MDEHSTSHDFAEVWGEQTHEDAAQDVYGSRSYVDSCLMHPSTFWFMRIQGPPISADFLLNPGLFDEDLSTLFDDIRDRGESAINSPSRVRSRASSIPPGRSARNPRQPD